MTAIGVCFVEIQEADDAEPRQHVLAVGRYVLGSSVQCDLRLRSRGVSRRHLELEVLIDGGVLLSDLGSRNGTCFAKRRITRLAITEPARFRLGEAELTVHPDTEAAHVVPLPAIATTTASRQLSQAPSLVTDLPGTTWLLLKALDTAFDEEQVADREISRVLSLWQSHLGVVALRLRHSGKREVLFAAGVWSAETAAVETIKAGGLALDLAKADDTSSLENQQLMLLRLGLRAISGRLAIAGPAAAVDASDVERKPALAGLISRPMQNVYQLAGRVAKGEVSVLIRGESGVGKELLARWLHELSPRRAGPFLAINCAALPADLLEAEIFGIERGVATGVEAREGLLERARAGTLFLDELGDMAPSTQAKLLRVLESDSFYRLGGSRPVALDVRFIAATHQHIESRIDEGSFRLDLLHRLAAVELRIPPLRERREDIAQLATGFLAEELAGLSRPLAGMTETALAALCEHDWPGNVRELRNEMARAALLLDAHQPLDVAQLSARIVADHGDRDLSLAHALQDAERRAFAIARTLCGDDHAAAMALLKLPRSSYFRRLRQLRGDSGNEEVSRE